MEKIKFIADTACDIPDAELQAYHIDMPSVPVAVDGVGYFERKSFTIHEFYKVLGQSKEIPATSRVPVSDYINCYKQALADGYTDIINVTINRGGSGTFDSAAMAIEQFYKEIPAARDSLKIHMVDSRTYSMAYGYPVIVSAQMAREGKSVAEILAYLDDFFSTLEIYLACYTLEYAKKSGRINAAAAFVGDVLGLRPIISLIDGNTKIVDRVRGEKQLLKRLVQIFDENCDDTQAPVLIIRGEVDAYAEELQKLLQKKLGRSIPVYYAGASIVINSGPKIAAVALRGKKRA